MRGLVLVAVAGLMLAACRSTKVVEVERVRTDTVLVNRTERDSIYVRDSVWVNQMQRGDTVVKEVERWRTVVRAIESHDTVYVATHDTVPCIVEVAREVEVSKALSWWQKLRIWVGNFGLLLILVGIFWMGWKIYLHLRRK